MKKIFISAFALTMLCSCGDETNASEENDIEVLTEMNEEEVVEMETTTEAVVDGLKELENEVESAHNDIDSLLENI